MRTAAAKDASWSLVQKPGAVARYRYREDLFPTMTIRRVYVDSSAGC